MNFNDFYQPWLNHLHKLVEQLRKALNPPPSSTNDYDHDHDHNHDRHELIGKTMSHYDEYYKNKSLATKKDVLSVVAAPWSTTLERSLHWIAGWRSTTAFHVVYTESSMKFETQLADILRGISFDDLSDLTADQLQRVSELQVETVEEENAISEELSQWQDGTSEIIESCDEIDGKMEKLVTILDKADALRMKTIKSLVLLLTPRQAIEFLIAVGQLEFGVRGWGVDHDRLSENVNA